MSRPESNAEAITAYAAWVQSQDSDDPEAWAALPAPEQDAWRRAVRLLALLGLAAED